MLIVLARIRAGHLQRLKAGEPLFLDQVDSAELLVVEGGLLDGAQPYRQGSWMRLPEGLYPEIIAGASGATVYDMIGCRRVQRLTRHSI